MNMDKKAGHGAPEATLPHVEMKREQFLDNRSDYTVRLITVMSGRWSGC